MSPEQSSLSPDAASRRHAQAGLAAAFLLATATSALLLRFPPDLYSFYPECPIHTCLHLQCPGCGATRALAALLHGRIADAFHRNALLITVILPAAILYAALCLFRLLRRDEFHWPAPPAPWRTAAISSGLVLALSFAILRNLHG